MKVTVFFTIVSSVIVISLLVPSCAITHPPQINKQGKFAPITEFQPSQPLMALSYVKADTSGNASYYIKQDDVVPFYVITNESVALQPGKYKDYTHTATKAGVLMVKAICSARKPGDFILQIIPTGANTPVLICNADWQVKPEIACNIRFEMKQASNWLVRITNQSGISLPISVMIAWIDLPDR